MIILIDELNRFSSKVRVFGLRNKETNKSVIRLKINRFADFFWPEIKEKQLIGKQAMFS